MLTAYQLTSSWEQGDGRLSGGWEAQVDFHLRNDQTIHSTIYHNDFASLLFIASEKYSTSSGLDDFLTSHTTGELIKELAIQSQPH
ncbi:MAG: hypothetical protein ACRYFX_10570 [Janthinobacterium lividum]